MNKNSSNKSLCRLPGSGWKLLQPRAPSQAQSPKLSRLTVSGGGNSRDLPSKLSSECSSLTIDLARSRPASLEGMGRERERPLIAWTTRTSQPARQTCSLRATATTLGWLALLVAMLADLSRPLDTVQSLVMNSTGCLTHFMLGHLGEVASPLLLLLPLLLPLLLRHVCREQTLKVSIGRRRGAKSSAGI